MELVGIKNKIKTLLINQLYPMNQFKDCCKGSETEKTNSYIYNKENAHILEIPLLNWSVISIYLSNLLLFLSRYPKIHYLINAFLGVSVAISFISMIIFSIIYLYLSYAPIVEIKRR